MPARLFVDSGAWIAFFSARDGHHGEADRLFRAALAAQLPLFTTNLVIAEVHRLLLHRAGIKAAAAALEKMEQSPSVLIKFVDETTHREALRWLSRLSDQVISYTDAASFAVMKANRCDSVIGFDRDFVIAGFSLWTGPARR